jgi:type-F conjugative transfer system secretin TraK
MINGKLKYLISLSLFWGTHTYAGSQVLTMDTNARVEASIARDYLNRIATSNDRITQVFGDEASYVIQVDENKGQIFIKPSEVNGLKPISLTLITESGEVQDITLKPTDRGATTVILKSLKKTEPAESTKQYASAQFMEMTLPVQEKMIKAMKLLVSRQFPESGDCSSDSRKEIEGLSITHRKSYQIGSYKGHQYEIANRTETLFEVDEKRLYQEGDLALSVGQRVLKPDAVTTLWVISR